MQKEYRDEIFRFFSTPENYKNMIQVSAHLDDVTNRIIEEFWEGVKKELDDKVKEITNVKVWQSGQILHDKTKLLLYRGDWLDRKGEPILGVAFEGLAYGKRPWIGVYFNIKTEDVIDKEALKTKINHIDHLNDWDDDNDPYWPKWSWLNIDMRTYDDLIPLLPVHRDNLILSLSDQLLSTYLKIHKDIPAVHSEGE